MGGILELQSFIRRQVLELHASERTVLSFLRRPAAMIRRAEIARDIPPGEIRNTWGLLVARVFEQRKLPGVANRLINPLIIKLCRLAVFKFCWRLFKKRYCPCARLLSGSQKGPRPELNFFPLIITLNKRKKKSWQKKIFIAVKWNDR